MAESPITVNATVIMSAAGKYVDVVSGVAITAGQACYVTNGVAYLADSNGSATSAAATGIAVNGAPGVGQPIRICTEDPDFTPGATLSISVAASSGVYCLSVTAGGIKPLTALTDMAAAEYPTVMFVAKSATKCVLKPIAGGTALTA